MSRVVLVHAQAAHVRLQLMDALRDLAEVLPAGTDPIRTLRASRPDVVLVAVRRRDRRQTLSLARSIKTDGRQPPLVGLIDPGGVLADPQVACERTDADGCLVGTLDSDTLRQLLEGLESAERVIVGSGTRRGLLGRR